MVGEEEADLEVDADADADSAVIQEKRKECDKYWALYHGIRRRSAGVFSVTTRYTLCIVEERNNCLPIYYELARCEGKIRKRVVEFSLYPPPTHSPTRPRSTTQQFVRHSGREI